MKKTEKWQKPIECIGFPDKCNEESCKEFPCDEINNKYAKKFIHMAKDDPYLSSGLKNWLELETWTPKEALLLLSNLSPDGAIIGWDDLEVVNIVNVKPLDENKTFFFIFFKHKDFEKFGKPGEEEIKIKFDKLKYYKEKLNRIKRLWDSGQHKKERYPIKYYLHWAKKKQIHIPWEEWAKNNGLLMHHNELSSQLNPRAEKTYLNIIGALLEVVTGSFKNETFSSETQLREFLAEKYVGFHGISKRTLADKFALAKKAINEN